MENETVQARARPAALKVVEALAGMVVLVATPVLAFAVFVGAGFSCMDGCDDRRMEQAMVLMLPALAAGLRGSVCLMRENPKKHVADNRPDQQAVAVLDFLAALLLGLSPLVAGFLWWSGVSFSLAGALLTLVVVTSYVLGAACLAADARRRFAAARAPSANS